MNIYLMPILMSVFCAFNLFAMDNPNLVFVKEYCSYAKNFEQEPGDVAAIDVNICTLVEISNFDEERRRTAFSLTHFTKEQLSLPEVISISLKKIIKNFEEHGGDIATAKIRIFGGTHKDNIRTILRTNLKNVISLILPSPTIEEPVGHHMNKEDQVIDYIFSKETIHWQKMVERNDPTKDKFSQKLATKEQRGAFRQRLDDAYRPLSTVLDQQTRNMNLKCNEYYSTLLDKKARYSSQVNARNNFSINIVEKDGLIVDDSI